MNKPGRSSSMLVVAAALPTPPSTTQNAVIQALAAPLPLEPAMPHLVTVRATALESARKPLLVIGPASIPLLVFIEVLAYVGRGSRIL